MLREAASRDAMAPAAWAARAALAVAAGKLVPVSADAKDVLVELIQARAELRRIGDNLNQIAHRLNAQADVNDAQLEAVCVRVDAAVQRVDDATVQVMRERQPR